jgi:phytoene dehydrogenase-like protein
MKDFDVIVVGSGIGGLISAGILSARGLKVLLIERHSTPGGYLASFKRKGFIFDSSVDCISGVAPGGLIYRVLELLKIEKDIAFIKVDPIRLSMFPNFEIAVDADINAYADRLSSLFPSEARSIRKFLEKTALIYSDTQLAINETISGSSKLSEIRLDILELMNSSYEDYLNEHVSDYRLKAILADRCPFIGLPPSGVSAFAMINMIMSYFKFGAYRPVGGFQRLANLLISGIENSGGEAIFGNGVKQILLDKQDRCAGVRCENGEEYTSRHIISNADFYHTFNSLLGGKYSSLTKGILLDPGLSTSFFILYAGVKGSACKHSSIGYFPSYDMESFFSPDMELREDSTIGITTASIEDSSRAPDGCSTVVLHEMIESSGKEIDGTECAEKIMKKAEKIIPGLRDNVIAFEAATPKTLYRYTMNLNGSAFGWKQPPGFKGIKRHGIKNLYIAGHWGDTGGGVLAAAYSGAKAAVEILAKEGIKDAI